MKIHTVQDTLNAAVQTFHLDTDEMPELIPWGIPALDDELGGLGPGSCGVFAGATGVGKSSIVLRGMLGSKVPVACISVEDTSDVVGTRIISALTGIDSLRIRKKDLTDRELDTIREAVAKRAGELSHMLFTYPIAGKIEVIEQKVIPALCDAGARMIWLDYLQEVQGTKADRRNEVSEVFRRCHAATAEGNAALMAVSQFRRMGPGEKVPQIFHLKESGDLENKARVIVLAHKVPSPPGEVGQRVHFRVGKSTYGGEHVKFQYVRDLSGTLQEADYVNPHPGKSDALPEEKDPSW